MRMLRQGAAIVSALPLIWVLAAGPSASQQQAPAQAAPVQAAPPASTPVPPPSAAPVIVPCEPTAAAIGQTLDATLVSSDRQTEAGNPHKTYSLQLQKDQTVIVTMTAVDRLLPFVNVGRCPGTPRVWSSISSARGFGDPAVATSVLRPAVLRYTAREAGEYIFRAVGLNKNVGRFTIAFAERVSPPPPPPTPVTIGQTLKGELSASSPILLDDGDRRYVRYALNVAAPGRLRLTTKSEDFDSLIRFGRAKADGTHEVITRSSGSGDRNVDEELYYAVTAPGQYLIDVAGRNAEDEGEFDFTLTSLPASAVAAPRPLKLEHGRSVSGRLDWTDAAFPELRDGAPTDSFRPYDLYEMEGRRGEIATITVESTDFDTQVEVGTLSAIGFATAARSSYSNQLDAHQNTSQVKSTFDRNGTVMVRVRSDRRGAVGAYVVSAQIEPAAGGAAKK